MKLISWNCQRGILKSEKFEKLKGLSPDIAVIQECSHHRKFPEAFDYEDAIWVGEDENIGLCVISFSKNYKLSLLVEEVKYEWVVPIKVTGDADFIMLAVWTKRIHGYSSYGQLLYAALKEYEHFLNHDRVIIIGDFNIDKKLSRSYSGIQGSQGFNLILDLLSSNNMVSCYHHYSNEEFGAESKATYHHHKKSEHPFHIDYCFVSNEWLQSIQHFYVGEGEEWVNLSDHFPLVIETLFSSKGSMDNTDDSIQNGNTLKSLDPLHKKEITPEILKEKYSFIIENEVVSAEEIDEAVKYIKVSRLMKQ
ncbi:hypothetical protein ACIFOT_31790 [Neobacillus sp. NRS-1170]|uniref:endonuclease/exonuclease/phosphatase family protein n=1 Tax=Neobacillus sp. NRS-1170 TaxID=3233898 RepID=UPI003D26935B